MTIEKLDSVPSIETLNLRSTRSGYDSYDRFNQLSNCYQQCVDQWASDPSVLWVRMVYHDPVQNLRQAVQSDIPPLPQSLLAYLKSEEWLVDFPLVLTFTEINLRSALKAYFCPIGYRDQSPEYFLVLTQEPLSTIAQHYMIQSARTLMQYSELFLSYYHQHDQIELLEHIIHRVGHQLRNPLGLIALYAENLCRTASEAHSATVIRETVQGLLTNLTELIYCGKSSQLKMISADVRSLILESIQTLQPLIEQKQIQLVYPDPALWLRMDRLQMKQVFDNLLSNAIHFSPESSTVMIDWTVYQGEVLIQISDQGEGLSQEDLKKIFNPFYSRRPNGTGLGLTIAKKIIGDHQGSIWAQNIPQGGARLTVTLPRDLAGAV